MRAATGSVKSASFRLGIGEGKWETVATWKPDSDGKATFTRNGKSFSIEHRKAAVRTNDPDSTTIKFRQDDIRLLWNVRLLAVGKDGRERATTPYDCEMTYDFYEMPLSSIKEFRFQVRPYCWAEFKDVQLNPQPIQVR